MRRAQDLAGELKRIGDSYGLDMNRINALERQQREGKVCVPVVGLFSSGKSSLLNALLGYGMDVLEVDIKPETAVPTELEYTGNEDDQRVSIYYDSGEVGHCSVKEYIDQDIELDAGRVKSICLTLNSGGLQPYPDIQLVDMPGFESGIEAHSRSIDGYVEKSMAYLITFAADGDMILKETVGDILKELCRYDMPLTIVITKRDKVDDEGDYEKKGARLKSSLKNYLGNRPMGWCETSSREEQIEPLRKELQKLQGQAEDLRRRKFCALVRSEAAIIQDHLKTRLDSISLSEPERLGKESELQAQIAEQEERLNAGAKEFELKLGICIQNIQNCVQGALSHAENNVVDKVLCGQGSGVGDYLNSVVRDALAEGIEMYYIPVVKKYIEDVSLESIGSDPGIHVSITEVNVEKSGIAGPILAGVAASVLTVPVIGLLVAGIFGIINTFQNNKKKKQAEQQVRSKLNGEIFPNITQQVAGHLRIELEKHSQQVIRSMTEQGNARKSALEQTLKALKDDIQKEQAQKEQDAQAIRADLVQVEEIINEL